MSKKLRHNNGVDIRKILIKSQIINILYIPEIMKTMLISKYYNNSLAELYKIKET